jgi:hypothetical protein
MANGKKLSQAAQRADMCENTARKYVELNSLPSELISPREHRTHIDKFQDVWSEVVEFLEMNPKIEAKTIFDYLCREYPEKNFQEGQLRTFQRKVKFWKAQFGHSKETYFAQNHHPGRFCQSDYTHMEKLKITINGNPFPHLLYHFVLTYSNWESADICFSESFESLSSGFQNALLRLGGVPKLHQTDGLSAAVNNLTEKRDFTQKYQALISHYSIDGQKTNPGSPNENGDIEQSNNRLKIAVDQRLMLRGSRDFATQKEYNIFLQELIKELNSKRSEKVLEERVGLSELPDRRLESCTRFPNVLVTKYSTIRVLHNVYSVPSRLIKEKVTVLAYSEHLEIWVGNKSIYKIPRIFGENKYSINYRHIVESLVRKPGAFENYKYRSDLFLSTHFRIVYDMLLQQKPAKANSIYVKILYHAAMFNENYVDRALKDIIDKDLDVTIDIVKEKAGCFAELKTIYTPKVDETPLSSYDLLIVGGVK